MPTSTFINLPTEKKDKIINAAINEFSSVSFDKASINKIIKEAGISRGSFYMYFEDIYDLTLYLLTQMKMQIMFELRQKYHGTNVQLDEMIISFHDVVYDYYANETYRNFFRNVIVYFQGRPEDEIKAMQGQGAGRPEFGFFKDRLDPIQFKQNDDEFITEVIELGMMVFRNVMFQTFIMSLDKEESSQLLQKGLNIIKHRYGRM
ncbi:MAG TPA: TetR family transcriptional regulator [Bacillota bacterium]|nr:TetR family transcriptional regulator [Bacillota bacterium]